MILHTYSTCDRKLTLLYNILVITVTLLLSDRLLPSPIFILLIYFIFSYCYLLVVYSTYSNGGVWWSMARLSVASLFYLYNKLKYTKQ